MAAGKPPEPASDARRRLREPGAARTCGNRAVGTHQETAVFDHRCVCCRCKGTQPPRPAPRHFRRRRLPLRCPGSNRSFRVWQTKPRSSPLHQRDHCSRSAQSKSQCHSLGCSIPGWFGFGKDRVREHLGWLEVRELLKGQPIDLIREQMLVNETASSERRISDAISQAYSVVVAVNESNEVQAFRVAVDNDPLFLTIKATAAPGYRKPPSVRRLCCRAAPMICGATGKIPTGQGPSRLICSVLRNCQDATPEGDTGYRRPGNSRRDLDRPFDASRPDGEDHLAYCYRRASVERPCPRGLSSRVGHSQRH